MRIRVNRDFGGRITDERRIPPGEYALDDPALFGVGQYLLDNGFAEMLEPLVVADAPVDIAIDAFEAAESDATGESIEPEAEAPTKPAKRGRK